MSAAPPETIRGSTRHLPEGRDFEYFCDAVADLYIGVRPERPDGPFPADFALHRFGETSLGVLSTPGTPAQRDRRSLALAPDDSLYLNFSRAAWTIDQLGRTWDVAPGIPLLLDNDARYRLSFDPRRRMRLYSLRLPRSAAAGANVRAIDQRMLQAPAGRHLAAQMTLLADMIDADRVDIAASMSRVVADLVTALAESDRTPPTERIAAYKDVARRRLSDPGLTAAVVGRVFSCSARTVQSVFADSGETFAAWLGAERLELARRRLGDPSWAGRSIAQIAASCGFGDPSTFHRAYRRRFGSTPARAR